VAVADAPAAASCGALSAPNADKLKMPKNEQNMAILLNG
jgi:hypothetical protein